MILQKKIDFIESMIRPMEKIRNRKQQSAFFEILGECF